MGAKADLHVHTKYSNRPSEWFLRRVGAPESFTEPMDVYRRCKARGMSYVTISDHNRIEGALEIAHLPDTFISSEITTYFPEDGCKIHCLVTGVSEAQFRDIDEARANIYEFQRYLLDNDIIYSVAHPLYSVNDRLSVDHVEKLLLLFNRFEGINGARDPRASELVNAIFRSLTPRQIEEMANRQSTAPTGEKPWRKAFTGGSDDHGGVYIACAYTVTPEAASREAFLDHLRHGRHDMGGRHGTSLQLAHSFFHIAWSYYRSKLMTDASGRGNFIAGLLERLLSRPADAGESNGLRGAIRGKVRGFVGKVATERAGRKLSDVERLLLDEFESLLTTGQITRSHGDHDTDLSQRETFLIASRISHQLGFSLFSQCLEQIRDGDLFSSLSTIASLGPVVLGVTPYLTATRTQHKDERLLQEVARRFPTNAGHLKQRSERRVWATDTFSDVNGVTTTIRAVAAVAQQREKPLTVLTCIDGEPRAKNVMLKNFQPVGEFALPEYESQRLAFPPFLEVIEYLEQQRVSELIISTPGPVGLTALMAGRLLNLKMTGIYHTDFPAYVRQLSEDPGLEALTWRYMHWFYDQMHSILVPSEQFRRTLIEHGFKPDKLQLFGRGVDTKRYNPSRCKPDFWRRFGLEDRFTFVYVGRVSAEKNIELLLASFMQLLAKGVDAQLAVVGDGPLLDSLRQRFRHSHIAFAGFLDGLELTTAYASSDAFVFPSTTDTFGNVVLEAMASGLPAIVSDRGGPHEIVGQPGGGVVINTDAPGAMVEAMQRLATDRAHHDMLAAQALALAESRTWDRAFEQLWHSGATETTPQRTPPKTTRWQGASELAMSVS